MSDVPASGRVFFCMCSHRSGFGYHDPFVFVYVLNDTMMTRLWKELRHIRVPKMERWKEREQEISFTQTDHWGVSNDMKWIKPVAIMICLWDCQGVSCVPVCMCKMRIEQLLEFVTSVLNARRGKS